MEVSYCRTMHLSRIVMCEGYAFLSQNRERTLEVGGKSPRVRILGRWSSGKRTCRSWLPKVIYTHEYPAKSSCTRANVPVPQYEDPRTNLTPPHLCNLTPFISIVAEKSTVYWSWSLSITTSSAAPVWPQPIRIGWVGWSTVTLWN